MSRARALVIALLVAAADAGALVVWWRVRAARDAIVAALRDVDATRGLVYRSGNDFEAEAITLAVAGGALLIGSLVTAIAGFVGARRRAGRSVAATSLIASAVIAGLVGAAPLLAARAFFSYRDPCGGDPDWIARYRFESRVSYGAPYEAMAIAVLVAAGIATVVILRLARRAPPCRERSLAAPIAVFAIGALAFALTRAQAYDARHPMPLVDERNRILPSQVTTLPPANGCTFDVIDAPLLTLAPTGWVVDGVAVSKPAAHTDANIAEIAWIFNAKRGFWQMLQPGRPFPGVVDVAMPAETPLATAAPALEALREAGYPILNVLERAPEQRFGTRTLGDVAYLARGCRVTIPAGLQIPHEGKWGELALTLAK